MSVMAVVLLVAFWALAVALIVLMRPIALAMSLIVLTMLLAGALIAHATFAPRLGAIAALGLVILVTAFGIALRFGPRQSD